MATSVLFWAVVSYMLVDLSLTFAWEEDALPGWMGDSYRETKSGIHAGGKSLLRGPDPIAIDPRKVVQVSSKPRAFLYKGFLSHEECDHIVALARDRVERSTVADNESGKSVLSEIRTSSGTFLEKYEDDIVKAVEDRIAAWTFLPKENGENIQVLRYNSGEKYEAHFDFFHDKANIQMGGHRIATVLMYLSDVVSGGETVFPSSKVTSVKDDSWSACGKQGAAVKPIKGDALLFFSLHPDATTDEMSLHAGCPVIKGEKWSATKWIHVSSFEASIRGDTSCENRDPHCEEWVAAGECVRNKEYMIGEGGVAGWCKKACNACDS